ncbi:MAG: hypothetical protein ACN6ON_04570 [Sphingobacterium sp.]
MDIGEKLFDQFKSEESEEFNGVVREKTGEKNIPSALNNLSSLGLQYIITY